MPDRSAWPHSLTVHHIVHRLCVYASMRQRLMRVWLQGSEDKPSSPRPSRTTPVMRSQHTSDMVGTSAKDCTTLRPFPVHTPHRTCMFRARIHPSQIALSVHTHTSATIASCHLTPAPLLPPAPCVRAVCTRQRSRVPLASQASPAPCSRGPAQGADDACAAGT